MPIINGMKMSCEPCIRGHRSTKCTHADERLMVPVKKPGRPLMACPHIDATSCTCSSITAAIRRKSKCGCKNDDGREASKASYPNGNGAVAANGYRVAKAAQAKKKQSASVDYMDLSSANIVPPAIRPAEKYTAKASTAPSNGYAPIMPQTPYAERANGQQAVPLAYPAGPYAHADANAAYTTPNDAYPQFQRPSETSRVPNLLDSPPYPAMKDGEAAGEAEQRPRGSCCSRDTPTASMSESAYTSNAQTPLPAPLPSDFPYNAAYPAGIPLYGYPADPSVYAYPASYGTYSNPVQPCDWRQIAQDSADTQPPNPLGGMPPAAFPPARAAADINTLHNCSCGPSCQCIGCAAHPYNQATQEYVASAYEGMDESLATPSAAFSTTSPPYDASSLFGGAAAVANGDLLETPAAVANGDLLETPAAELPPTSETPPEEPLSASDFFFVNYPVNTGNCGGNSVDCPCGDDCQCIGCSIHQLDYRSAMMGLGMLRDGEQNGAGLVAGASGEEKEGLPAVVEEKKVSVSAPEEKLPVAAAVEVAAGDGAEANKPVRSCCGG